MPFPLVHSPFFPPTQSIFERILRIVEKWEEMEDEGDEDDDEMEGEDGSRIGWDELDLSKVSFHENAVLLIFIFLISFNFIHISPLWLPYFLLDHSSILLRLNPIPLLPLTVPPLWSVHE